MLWFILAHVVVIASGMVSGYGIQRWLFYKGWLPDFLSSPDIGAVIGGLAGVVFLWV